MHILAISGSLRAQSSNTAVVRAFAMLAQPPMTVEIFEGLGSLPYFNPDLDTDEHLPDVVRDFRKKVGAADALLICSPEYARGVAGVMKNALDWLVGSFEFPGKPVAVINASQRSTHADAALRLTLATMAANIVEEASITLPLLGRGLDVNGIVADEELAGQLRAALEALEVAPVGPTP